MQGCVPVSPSLLFFPTLLAGTSLDEVRYVSNFVRELRTHTQYRCVHTTRRPRYLTWHADTHIRHALPRHTPHALPLQTRQYVCQ